MGNGDIKSVCVCMCMCMYMYSMWILERGVQRKPEQMGAKSYMMIVHVRTTITRFINRTKVMLYEPRRFAMKSKYAMSVIHH